MVIHRRVADQPRRMEATPIRARSKTGPTPGPKGILIPEGYEGHGLIKFIPSAPARAVEGA